MLIKKCYRGQKLCWSFAKLIFIVLKTTYLGLFLCQISGLSSSSLLEVIGLRYWSDLNINIYTELWLYYNPLQVELQRIGLCIHFHINHGIKSCFVALISASKHDLLAYESSRKSFSIWLHGEKLLLWKVIYFDLKIVIDIW